MKKVIALILATVMLLVCFAACGENTETKTTVKWDTKTYSMIETFDITTLDYVYNNKSSNGDYTSNFIEGLLTQDSHGTLIAGMAERWEANEDASVWTFYIRDNADWVTSEGEVYAKVTAEDFVTGMKHAVDSKSETLSLVEDLIVNLNVWTPKKLSKDEEKIMRDLLESDNFKPKPGANEKGVFDKIRDFFS